MSTNTVSFPQPQFQIHSQLNNRSVQIQEKTFFQQPVNSKYQFYAIIEIGNNSNIVKQVLAKRNWWSEAPTNSQQYNLRWKPTSYGIKFEELTSNFNKKVMVNHIEFHSQITSKNKLYNNIKHYCKQKKINMDNFIPKTFILQPDSDIFEKELSKFLDYYLTIDNGTSLKNIWITKPSDLNRGRGIYLFNDLQNFYNLLKDYGKEESLLKLLNSTQRGKQLEIDTNTSDYNSGANLINNQSLTQLNGKRKSFIHKNKVNKNIVIQKYLETPLLIANRKFDIRVWVLIDQDMNYHFFKEGYVRMASEYFDISSKKLNNQFIHLTNNAIQKHSQNYSKYEPGNIISFKEFQRYLKSENSKISFNNLIQQMKQQVEITMQSAQTKLKKCGERKYNFELFGYDFMIDTLGQVYLIEVNTNPCLEESSTYLSKLIQRMLNDMFRITVDKIFNPTRNMSDLGLIIGRSKPNQIFSNGNNVNLSDFQLDGYSCYENLWENIGDLNYSNL